MRIRSVKPDFWHSEEVTAVPREVRLLLIGLSSYVDDNGVGIDDYRLVAAKLFPLEDDQNEIREYIREGLATLQRVLLITRYEVDGKRYLFVNNFDAEQRVDKPNKPRYPRPVPPGKPPTSGNTETAPEFSEVSRDPRETPAPGVVEKRRIGEREEDSLRSSSPSAIETADPPRDDVDQLCARLRDRVTDNGAKATITRKWRTAARLLLDRDKRELDQALRLIDWATAHQFWSSNILSMPKFREKYDQLLMQARREQQRPRASPPGTGTPRPSTTDQRVAAAQALKRQPGAQILQLPGAAS